MAKGYLKKVIEELYEAEVAMDVAEREEARFTATVQQSDLAIVDAICRRFKTTRTSLVRDIFHNAAMELFLALETEDKLALGKEADDAIYAHCKEVFDKFESVGGQWSGMAEICAKEDAKNADA